MKKALLIFVAQSSLIMEVAAASVSSASIRQDWPWSTNTEITYTLEDVTDPVDIAVVFRSGGVVVPSSALGLSGDVYGVKTSGSHVIKVDPVKTFGTVGAIGRLTAEVTCMPQSELNGQALYKVVDLVSGEVTDITRGDILNGDYGSYEVDYGKIGPGFNTSLDDVLIWTGITNNLAKYAGTHMVFRRIPAGTFNYCVDPSKTNSVTVSKDYYIGVFKVTYAQIERFGFVPGSHNWTAEWYNYWGGDSPAERAVCYKAANGLTSESFNSPGKTIGTNNLDIAYGTSYYETSLLRKLMYRIKTGPSALLVPLNAPSQAKWHRAMRAGTDTYYYDGLPEPSNPDNNAQFNRLGFCKHNGGMTIAQDGTETENGPCEVGRFLPNAFGLYDMLGNLWEAAQDQYSASLSGTDPCGKFYDASYPYACVLGTSYKHGGRIRPQPISANQQVHSHSGERDKWGVRLCFVADEVVSVADYEAGKSGN